MKTSLNMKSMPKRKTTSKREDDIKIEENLKNPDEDDNSFYR